MRFWAKIKIDQKIINDCEYEREINENDNINVDLISDILVYLCNEMDLSRPVILKKHIKQLNEFSKTEFSKNDFIEKIKFDCLEIELI